MYCSTAGGARGLSVLYCILHAAAQVDLLVTQFMNSLQDIDNKLTDNIKYLTQVRLAWHGMRIASEKAILYLGMSFCAKNCNFFVLVVNG